MSILTKAGQDIIRLTEDHIQDVYDPHNKVHLIRLSFDNPTNEIMDWVLDTFKKTNRYVIDNEHIRFYNYFFKRTNFKYYVINIDRYFTGLVSFFKRNNKVLLDITKLDDDDKRYILLNLADVLSNTEVIIISKDDYNDNITTLKAWKGNIILHDKNYVI